MKILKPKDIDTLLHKTKRIQVFNIRLNGGMDATFAAGLIAKVRDGVAGNH
jgi:hypothetical protein